MYSDRILKCACDIANCENCNSFYDCDSFYSNDNVIRCAIVKLVDELVENKTVE